MLTERIPSHQEEHPMKIPGVSVEEVPSVPPAVVPADTAIPVFIGYTEKAIDLEGRSLANVPQRIQSLRDYEQFFGGAYPETLYVDVTQAAGATPAARFVNGPAGTNSVPFFLPSFLLHYSVALFYANGGGPCFVLSIGPYAFRNGAPDISSAVLEGAFPILEAHVGPTLIVIPDACRLSLTAASTDIQTVADVATAALAHCRKMQDRFAIIDVPISQAAIVPGAASTVLEADITFRSHLTDDAEQLKYGAAYYPYVQSLLPYATSPDTVHITSTLYDGTLTGAQTTHPDVYDAVNRLVGGTQALLPPSGAVAGLYARVDNTRGVWKAPAGGDPIEAVAGPVINVTDAFGGILGSDPSGKSINVIRSSHRARHPHLGCPHAGRQRRRRSICERAALPHLRGAIDQEGDGPVRVRGQRCRHLDQGAWHDREFPCHVVENRCAAGQQAGASFHRGRRAGHDDDTAGHPRRQDDRGDRPSRGEAGRIHHPPHRPVDAQALKRPSSGDSVNA